MTILFITRRFPPSVGGIQNFSHNLYQSLTKRNEVKLIALKNDSKWHLVWFWPYAFFRSSFYILFKKMDCVYFSDGVICSLAFFLRLFTKLPFFTTIYGLELTYGNKIIVFFITLGVRSCQKIFTISKISAGIIGNEIPDFQSRIVTIYPGVEVEKFNNDQILKVKDKFEKKYKIKFCENKILLSIGRLIKRKGIADFIEKGFDLIQGETVYLIAGNGPEIQKISHCAKGKSIIMLGKISEKEKYMLLENSDVFLMPNVKVENDVEGFGIAPLEAMSLGVPVVAFAIDALPESINQKEMLAPKNDYRLFSQKINYFLNLNEVQKNDLSEKIANYVKYNFSWGKVAEQYVECFSKK